MKKVEPAKLTLADGKEIYIIAADGGHEVDIKVVDADGDDVYNGILITIKKDGIYRISNVNSKIGIPVNSRGQTKLSKDNYQ